MTTHHGSCHCGRIRFEVDGEPASGLACNCSICRRKGSLLWFVPRAAMRLLTPEADAQVYTFHRHAIRHRFCPVCGIHPYADATNPKGEPMAAINLRCVEDVDLDAVPVTHFDGRAI